jgi:hypothetical protein
MRRRTSTFELLQQLEGTVAILDAAGSADQRHVVLDVELRREASELLRELRPAVLHGKTHEGRVI